MITGQILALVGSIMSALAPNVNTLVGGSVFIGLAASTQVLFPLLAQEIVPNKYRGYAQGSALFMILPAIGFGPIIGRSFVARYGTSMGWRAVFWMNGGVALVSLLLFFFCYFPPGFKELQEGMSRMREVKRIDYGGLVLYATGLICLLLALCKFSHMIAWDVC
jgi:MFS family permease